MPTETIEARRSGGRALCRIAHQVGDRYPQPAVIGDRLHAAGWFRLRVPPSARRSHGGTHPPPAHAGCDGLLRSHRRGLRLGHCGHGSRWSPWCDVDLRSHRLAGLRLAAQHCILVANDPPGELEGLVAIVGFRRTQRAIEDFAGKCRGGRLLECLDQFAGRFQPAGAFIFGTDIGDCKREIDASRRDCPPGPAA